MLVDVRTLILCNGLVTACLAASLLVYRASQKTYPGYAAWTAGTTLLTIGYLAFVFRGQGVVWPSILIANSALSVGGLLRLDGICRFLGRRPMPRAAYGAPLALLAILGYFTFAQDSIAVRTLAISLYSALVAFAVVGTVVRRDTRGKTLYRVFGGLHLGLGLVLVTRALYLMANPEYALFAPIAAHVVLFVAITVFEVGIGFSFIMLNSVRLEAELNASRSSLAATLADLRQTVSEVKVLSGLLPICAACKKIRDDQGYWRQIETYLRDHSEAEFTHGLCPDCAKRLYPRSGAERD